MRNAYKSKGGETTDKIGLLLEGQYDNVKTIEDWLMSGSSDELL
jgi:hypothetical protein